MGIGPVLGSQAQLALAANGELWAAGMTGRTLGANHAIPITAETIRRIEQKEENSEQVGQIHRRSPIHVGEDINGEVTFQGDYNFLPFALAYAMGTAGVPTETEASLRYTHRL